MGFSRIATHIVEEENPNGSTTLTTVGVIYNDIVIKFPSVDNSTRLGMTNI
jgi:hypothetical protein